MKAKELALLLKPQERLILRDENAYYVDSMTKDKSTLSEYTGEYDVIQIKTAHAKEMVAIVKKPFNKEEWVHVRYLKYRNDNRVSSICRGNTTFVINETQPWKYGWSRRKEGDKDNARVAIAVAYARYLGEEIPKEI